ncbi:MAG: hypothetical protein ACJ07L_15205 [Opitutales bacterium]
MADTFESIGTIDAEGEDSISFQMVWTRSSPAQNSSSFTINNGLASTIFSASVPDSQSTQFTNPITFTLYDYEGGTLGPQIWTIGDSLITRQ